MEALQQQCPGATFYGLGGRRMEALGFEPVVRAEDVAVMGITEILRHVPKIYREYRRLKRSLTVPTRPDVALLIDFPDVNLSLARECRRHAIPVVFFVSPQVWAWKKHRIPQIRRDVDQMLVIFPFEEPFYQAHGVSATFVGHPLAELPLPVISREAFAQRHSLDPARQWVGLLPGSRAKEIRLNLPEMLAAAAQVARAQQEHGIGCEFVIPLAPTLTAEHIAAAKAMVQTRVRTGVRDQPGDDLRVVLVNDARATLHHARASIVASGTATVEAALIGNPFLVVYRVTPVTYAVARRVVKVPHVAMANLIAGQRAVPELIQSDFTADNITRHLLPLLNNPLARQTMEVQLARIGTLLQSDGSAIEQVAKRLINIAHRQPQALES
jgi:lipid-A-disaccharide synthase